MKFRTSLFKTITSGRVFHPIPNILHQTWKNSELPEKWHTNRQTWLDLHPDWKHMLWTDDDNRNLIKNHYPWFLDTFDRFPRHIQRVDAAKYFILYTYGGVYADLDTECLIAVDPIINAGGAILSRTPDGVIDGAFLAAPEKHSFWRQTFEQMQAPTVLARFIGLLPGCSASMVLFTTGPQMLRVACRRFLKNNETDEGVTTLHPNMVSSRSWLKRFQPFPDVTAYVHHHHDDSWLRPAERLVHQYFNIFTLRMIWLVLGCIVLGLSVIIIR